MPAIGPEPAASSNESVHVKRDADRETADTGGQSSLVARFDHKVQVVPLNREMNDSKVQWIALGGAFDCKADGGKHVLAA